MRTFYKIYRSFFIAFLCLHFFIFAGVTLQGIIDWGKVIISIDYGYSLFYMIFGLIVCLIFAGEIHKEFRADWQERLYERWKRNLNLLIVSTFLFLITYFFRFELQSLILYVGFEIGAFFIQVATSAIKTLTGVNLNDIGFHYTAWLFQWHFVFAACSLVLSIVKKTTSILSK